MEGINKEINEICASSACKTVFTVEEKKPLIKIGIRANSVTNKKQYIIQPI